MSGDKLNRQLPVTVDYAKARQLHMRPPCCTVEIIDGLASINSKLHSLSATFASVVNPPDIASSEKPLSFFGTNPW